jgi:hypothetical protein
MVCKIVNNPQIIHRIYDFCRMYVPIHKNVQCTFLLKTIVCIEYCSVKEIDVNSCDMKCKFAFNDVI